MNGKSEKPECFVICPFGEEDTKERKRSDELFNGYIKPVATSEGYSTFRSIDREGTTPGLVTAAVIEILHKADLVVADLTGSNANVYYELALRHATAKPVIMLAENPDELKFDVRGFNVIRIRKDYLGGKKTEEELRDQIRKIKSGEARFENAASELFSRASKRARVFHWTMTYGQRIAAGWLDRQDPEFRECAKAFDNNQRLPENPRFRNLIAHYVAFKLTQNASLPGELFYVFATARAVEFQGWGHFILPGSEPMHIWITGEERGSDKVVIRFKQPPRDMQISGMTETIEAFNYSVELVRVGRTLEGDLRHPWYPGSDPLVLGTMRLSEIE